MRQTVRKFSLFHSEWKKKTTPVLTLPVNVKNFDRKFESTIFLTCVYTETGAVTQRVNKS